MQPILRSNFDEIDYQILTMLVEDGRKSFTEIAQELGVSAGTVRNRFARLEEQGALRIIGVVDSKVAGINVTATIFIKISPTQLIPTAVETLLSYPEIGYCASVAGEHDLMVDASCIDNEHLVNLLHKRIMKIEGVQDTRTTVILKIYKFGQPDLTRLQESADALADAK